VQIPNELREVAFLRVRMALVGIADSSRQYAITESVDIQVLNGRQIENAMGIVLWGALSERRRASLLKVAFCRAHMHADNEEMQRLNDMLAEGAGLALAGS